MLGRYQLRGVLGRGGMAEVRDGWDIRLDRPVAIKMLHPGVDSQPGVRDRFKAEALAAAALNHPNIVAVHDSGEHDGTLFIVMERLPGGTLADHIALGPLPEARVRAMLDNILAALATAHAHGTLHRDIKPGNILHTAGGIYKLADFGIAKTGGAAYTMTGQIIGTIAYLSPERLSGAPASVADDLYAVGVVGYEAITGRHAFYAPDDNIGALAKSILYDTPAPVHVARPDVAPQFAAVIERALSRDPRQRFSGADEMRAALNGQIPVVPNGPYTRPTRPPTKVLDSPPLPPTFIPPLRAAQPLGPGFLRAASKRTKRVLAAAGLIAALALTAFVLALDSPTTLPAHPVSDSTTSVSPPPPTSASPLPPPPPTTPVIQQSDDVYGPPAGGNGKKGGNGNGHGKGPKK